jgi:hypothetical protein
VPSQKTHGEKHGKHGTSQGKICRKWWEMIGFDQLNFRKFRGKKDNLTTIAQRSLNKKPWETLGEKCLASQESNCLLYVHQSAVVM